MPDRFSGEIMAIYKLNSKKKKEGSSRGKKITGFSFIGASSLVFLFMTGIVPVIQRFLIGVFGVFGFPLCIIMFVIGLALVNNRKYVMPKRYTACLILSVFFVLCILQLIIVGNNKFVTEEGTKQTMNFWKYMAKNYNCHNGWTAGGFLVGIFTTIILYIATIWGSFIIYALSIVICVALMIDSLNYMRKNQSSMGSVSVQIKDSKVKNIVPSQVREEEYAGEEINVVLDGNLKEQEELLEKKAEEKPLTAKQILGLDKKRNKAYEFDEKTSQMKSVDVPKKSTPEPEKPKSLKEIILTPPEIDIDEYFKNLRRGNDVPAKEEVQASVNAIKKESSEINPSKVVHEDEFRPDNSPIIRRSLPEIKGAELTLAADDILRSVIQEEKKENPEYYENIDIEPAQDAEKNLLDRLPNRDNTGSFERQTSSAFDRRSETNQDSSSQEDVENKIENSNSRETFDRNNRFMRLDRGPVTQEDKDARDAFNRDFDRISRVNGTLSREQQPIAAEEEELPPEPYIYEKPSLDFITTKSVDLSTLNEEVAEKRVALENALEMFGVPAKVQGVVVGPAVTRYELEMPQGVSVSKIKSHVDDIAYALAAEGAIRVEAPVPGKSVVGIEVPNASIATISLRDILDSSEFKQASSPLTFAIGKDITGRVVCANMQKLTHLLVAGSTGSGKSVCLNSIILSIIYKASPEDVKIVLIDPKRVEFSSYEALPHLIMPKIVCDTQKAISTLSWAVDEMEKRFEILGNARVKNIDEFNQTSDVVSGKKRKMPFLVIIVDELADLMMTGKKEVEDKVCRLAQKARAAGIHLILATQRPSVDVITGLIKSNFPSRISFSVTSAVDSMTILDRVGAEKLLGKGDMLYFPNGAKDPARIQGCFIGTNEINSIVDFVRDSNEPRFDKSIEDKINNPNSGNVGGGAGGKNDDLDPLLPQVLKASIDAKVASATMIRRRFAIGYPRAARIIDQMEEAGYISSADGVKPRTVYITEEEFNDIFGDVDY